MMHSSLLSLLLTSFLFIQCGAKVSQPKNLTASPQATPSPTIAMSNSNTGQTASDSQETISSGKSTETKCDFSAYAPTRKSHFVQAATLKKPKPEYPPEAASRGIQGQVQVKILVNDQGVVEKACAISGDESLRGAAEAAALQWKFKPNFGFRVDPSKTGGKKRYIEDFLLFTFDLDKKNAGSGNTVTP